MAASALPIQVASGPIIKKVKGTTISKVTNGTKKVFTTVGIHFLHHFSTTEANQTAKIIGITVEV